MTPWFYRYSTILKHIVRIRMDIATIKDLVAQEKTQVDKAVALLNGLHQQLKDVSAQLAASGADTTALDEVAAGILANTQSLATAVAADTDPASTATTGPAA